jgi:hypothetical protein
VKVVIDTILAPELIGGDATRRESCRAICRRNFTSSVAAVPSSMGFRRLTSRCGISPAKRPADRSTTAGGGEATSLAAYASLIRYADPELIRINVQRAVNSGFRHLKLHEVDVEVIAPREAAGPGVEITLDVNAPWTVREALDMTEKLRPLNLRWIEEPVWPPENYSGLAMRQQGGIPVAGENASTLMDFQHLLRSRRGRLRSAQPGQNGRHHRTAKSLCAG